jgi:hypothetical protein
MRHRGLLIIGLAALAARTAMLLLRPAGKIAVPHTRPAYSRPDLARELSAQLNDAVARELEPFARDQAMKKLRGEPYVDLNSKFEYAPAYGFGGRVAISVMVGGPMRTTLSGLSGVARTATSQQVRYLVFTYALVEGRWVELSKPRWETRERSLQPTHAAARQVRNDNRAGTNRLTPHRKDERAN